MSTPTPATAAAYFRRFDVVSNPADHSFLHSARNPDSISRAASKTIFREWKILEQHLPDSIFVRVYDKQIDLLSAAIVGRAGTPYHDGLYFFDIAFPTNYPQSPPKVTFRSFGLRINSWRGTEIENWNPKNSTILKVLVSIQRIVLNEKPYFNQLCFIKNDRLANSYNEHVFERCCKAMLQVIWKPPRNFERLVWSHFRERRFGILKAIEFYANGKCRAGYYGRTTREEEEEKSNSKVGQPPSAIFKRTMLQLHLELSGAFAKLAGTCAEDFKEKSVSRFLAEKEKREREKDEMEDRLVKCCHPTFVIGLFLELALCVYFASIERQRNSP